MGRIALRLLFPVVLCAVASTLASAATPLIELVEFDHGRNVMSDGSVNYSERVYVTIVDPDGSGDIVSVAVTDTELDVHVATPSGTEDPDPSVRTEWSILDGTTVCVMLAWANYAPAPPPPTGQYEVTVSDQAGGSDSLLTPPVGPVPEASPEILHPAPNNSVVHDTRPEFAWISCFPGAHVGLWVWEETPSGRELVWNYQSYSDDPVSYNFDNTASQPDLIPGHVYSWVVVNSLDEDHGVTDPRVIIRVQAHHEGRFAVYWSNPVIHGVGIHRGRNVYPEGTVAYHESVWVDVSDFEGVEDIASVTVTDTEGSVHVIIPPGGGETEWYAQSETALWASWSDWGTATPPPPGIYSVIVTDLAGHSDTVTANPLGPVPEISVELIAPEPYYPIIGETQPTFSWACAADGAEYNIRVHREGGDGELIWEAWPGSATTVQYNYDGNAADPELVTGQSYWWTVTATFDVNIGQTDPRIWAHAYPHSSGRFQVNTDPVPVEGKMFVSSDGGTYFLEGDSNNRTFSDVWFSEGDISPHGDRMAYDQWLCCLTGAGWPDLNVEIWTANLDGSGAFNVSGVAGLGGANCFPQWSPDGSMIAFQHSEGGPGGVVPCEAGFHVWVMNADGTDAHRVSPEGHDLTFEPRWAPNGYRLLFSSYTPGWSEVAQIMIDIDGTDVVEVPNVGDSPRWSPDGAQIASSWTEPGIVAGEPGVWRQLRVTDADGSAPVTLVEKFVGDSEAVAHLQAIGADPSGLGDLQWQVGPILGSWSPAGDRIAFIGAWPFDPSGPAYNQQKEVWIYDLGTQEISQVTYDWWPDWVVSWGGPNTSPEDPSVTVDNTTITFSDVADDGLTTIIRDDDPPAAPTGYQFCGEYYEIDSTATYTGPISICMSYDEADIPHGNENSLKLMHYNEATGDWENITTSHDKVANILCGEASSLSVFGIAAAPEFVGLLQPVNNDGSSIFKLNRTVPVKFQLVATDGSYVSDAVARLYVAKVTDEVVGSYEEPESTSAADSGNTFRYDATSDQYIFNLGTKSLSTGTWSLQVTVNGMVMKEVWISLR